MSPSLLEGVAVIALSALLVWGIRFLGLVLGEKLPRTGFWKRAMDALPGAVFAALVFPGIVGAGIPGGVAAGVIFAAIRKTGNVLLALFLGVGTVALLRGAGL
jgi:branched-subunit amino acid transport protein